MDFHKKFKVNGKQYLQTLGDYKNLSLSTNEHKQRKVCITEEDEDIK